MIEGFSKLPRNEKIASLALNKEANDILQGATIKDSHIANIIDDLSENTISHYTLPFGIAPNVLMNGKSYFLPLVTEESSVVAAIAKAAKFWAKYGGFKTKVLGTEKKGQVHFFWKGEIDLLMRKANSIYDFVQLRLGSLNRKMKKRGGGLKSISLIDKTNDLDDYFQLDLSFETADAMGANFINSCLEEAAKALKQFFACDTKLNADLFDVSMAILSNYTPNCKVLAYVSCKISDLNTYGKSLGIADYSTKFINAVNIAKVNVNRAVTHNKGIYNGVDALALATGNDWRAIEACGHAYAAKSNKYCSLSDARIEDENFIFELELPLAVGTVGGITNLHPLAKIAIQILYNPSAKELMQLMAISGLAANFSAINALISTGIQKGHMKMHVTNILKQFKATDKQSQKAIKYFEDKVVSYSSVESWLKTNT